MGQHASQQRAHNAAQPVYAERIEAVVIVQTLLEPAGADTARPAERRRR